ncbi:MAG: putative toxin-antitoxin system toxin component, PIN family [bacterium]
MSNNNLTNLTVVIDTNVLLGALPSHSPYRLLFNQLLEGAYELVISNAILTEYEEQITARYDSQVVQDLLAILLLLPNVRQVTPYFQWHLIVSDPDDNKFVDAAISGNVDYMVTNDKHFQILKTAEFPKVNVCKAEAFKTMLLNASRSKLGSNLDYGTQT